jgi:hypothetical protein
VIRLLGIFVENRRSKSRHSFRNGSIERGEAAVLGKTDKQNAARPPSYYRMDWDHLRFE